MNNLLSEQETRQVLGSVLNKEPKTWAQISHLMASVDALCIWDETAGSFTEWVQMLALTLNKTESSFWRYLKAGRYYVNLRHRLLAQGYSCVPLYEVTNRVSPENLELMEKIERVAPDELKKTLIQRVVVGEVPRSELRDYWRAFRPILEGKNARGKEVPIFNASNRQQQHLFSEAMMLKALMQDKGAFLAGSPADAFHVFMGVSPLSSAKENHRGGAFDVVITVGSAKTRELSLHGFEVINYIGGYFFERLAQLKPYCDFMWVVITEQFLSDLPKNQLDKIDKDIGLLVINGAGDISIKRVAEVQEGQSEVLAKTLLWELLK